MQIHHLQDTPIAQIADCFTEAFKGYFLPIQFDEQQLRDKIKSDNILLEYSVGITIGNELAGFILIGIDVEKKLTYNAGTGVLAKYRGQKFTEKMYAFLLPKLRQTDMQNHFLEVICENQKALRIYESLGYSILRKVVCYKGKVSRPKSFRHKIEPIELPYGKGLEPFWNHKPTYQNSRFCITNSLEKHMTLGAFDNQKLIGYIVFDKNSLRIKQFGIDKAFRRKGLGHQLFYEVQAQKPEVDLLLINIDENDTETDTFLKEIGFNPILSQFEMALETS